MKHKYEQASSIALLIFLSLLLGGCASPSGGGSPPPPNTTPSDGSSGNVPSQPNPTPAPAPAPSLPSTLPQAVPNTKETGSRPVQRWLDQVNKPFANQLGTGNGQGVTVGVVDSGVQTTHPELSGRIFDTYNAFNESKTVTDEIGHGTHVSGIIAGTNANGSPFEGVAPGATLAIAKVFNSATSDTVTIAKGIDWAVNTKAAPIVSLSLGTSVEAMKPAIQNAVNKGALLVAALGNDGLSTAASWPAEFAKESWANGQIIAVGAVDSNNKLASFSNVDSTLANWTVVAPGVNVASSYSVPGQQNAYSFMSGTSMATPIVSGQAALIKSNWNFLSAKDLASIIFKTAKHLCSDQVTVSECIKRTTPDPTYGWGLVDIAASLQPVGELQLEASSGTKINYSGTKLATPKSGLASNLKGLNVVAVDSFNRGFLVNLNGSVTNASVTTTGMPQLNTEIGQPSNKLGFQFASGSIRDSTQSNRLGLFGYTPFSLANDTDSFGAPYAQFLEDATKFAFGHKVSGDLAVRFIGSIPTAEPGTSKKAFTGIDIKKAYSDRETTVYSIGQLREESSILGLSGTGALATDNAANTTFMSFSKSVPVSFDTTVVGMIGLGSTLPTSNKSSSLFSGTTHSYSMSWSLGFEKLNTWTDRDALIFEVSMPLRTMTGQGTFRIPTGQNQSTGALSFEDLQYDLAPNGFQTNWDVSYIRPISKSTTLGFLFQAKFQAGHESTSPSQYGVGLRLRSQF